MVRSEDGHCNSTRYDNFPLSPNFIQSQAVGLRARKDVHRAVILPTSLNSSATTYHLQDTLEFQFFSERKQGASYEVLEDSFFDSSVSLTVVLRVSH